MARLLQICALVLIIRYCNGQNCSQTCNLWNCEQPIKNCTSGRVKDRCDCCFVCGLTEGQQCDIDVINENSTRFDTRTGYKRKHGRCGENLQCEVEPYVEFPGTAPPMPVCQNVDIRFDVIPDIVFVIDNFIVDAFKMRSRRANETRKWASIGYPRLIKSSDGQIFQFTSDHVLVKIQLLDERQTRALVGEAKRQYPNKNITSENFVLTPLVKFECNLEIVVDGQTYSLTGNVHNFETRFLLLSFPAGRGSEKRLALEKRIRNNTAPLSLQCSVASTGKREQTNLTSEEMAEKIRWRRSYRLSTKEVAPPSATV